MLRFQFATVAVVALLSMARAEPPKADAYGDPLPVGAVARLGSMRLRVGNGVHCLSFQPDGTLLTISDDFIGQEWDTATGREVRHYDVRTAIPEAPVGIAPSQLRYPGPGYLAQSADGRRLALISADRAIYVLDGTSRIVLKKIGPLDNLSGRLVLSHNGARLAIIDAYGAGRAWDTTTRSLPHFLSPLGQSFNLIVTHSQFSLDGKSLLQLGIENDPNAGRQVHVAVKRDLEDGQDSRIEFARTPDNPVTRPALSPDARALAVPLRDAVQLVNLADGREIARIPNQKGADHTSYLFSQDGKTLIGSSGPGGSLTVWQVPSGKVVRKFDGQPTMPRPYYSFFPTHASPDGKTLVWADGPALTLIDLDTGKSRFPSTGHTGSLREASFSTNGREVMTRATDGRILRWNPNTGREVGAVDFPTKPASYHVTADGRWMMFRNDRGNFNLHVLDAMTMKESRIIQPFDQPTGFSWGLSPDSRHVAFTAYGSQSVRLFDITSDEKRLELTQPIAPPRPQDESLGGATWNRLFFSNDGGLVGIASEAFITIWNVANGRMMARIPRAGLGALRHASIAPDGTTVDLDTSAGITIWEVATSTKRYTLITEKSTGSRNDSANVTRTMSGGLAFPMTLALSPDGRMLAQAGDDRSIRLWDAWEGKELGTFNGHRGAIISVAFSPDGQRLVSASTDTTALVWDVGPVRDKLQQSISPLDASTADSLWAALTDADGKKAFDAMRKLAGDPARVIELSRTRVKPAEPADAGALAKWVAELDDPKFTVREKAQKELAQLGERAGPALRKASAESSSAQVRQSVKQLLERLNRIELTSEQLRAVRAIEVLERIGTSDAVELLKTLSAGVEDVAPTPQARSALHRLRQRMTPNLK